MGIHDDAPVRQFSADHIKTGVFDRHAPVIYIGAVPFNGCVGTFQGDPARCRRIPIGIQIICGKVFISLKGLRISIDCRPDTEGGSVHKQRRDQDHDKKYSNADTIKLFTR